MKKKDLIDLKNKSQKDLAIKAKELRKSITELALELKLGKSKNVHETRHKRKEIAQVLTYLELKNIDEESNRAKSKTEITVAKPSKVKKEVKNDTK